MLRGIPLNRILIETDCPYISPQAYRGRRNEPSYVIETAMVIADLKGISIKKLGEVVTQNFVYLFKPEQRA